MAHNPLLYELTLESLDTIVDLLSFEDCCNLRLVSSTLALRLRSTRFASQFNSTTIRLTTASVEAFSAATDTAWLSSTLKHLKLVGVLGEPKQKETSLSHLLAHAFTNIKQHHPTDALDSLTLVVDAAWDMERYSMRPRSGIDVPPWKQVWTCAAASFESVADAVQLSGLWAKKVDVYGTSKRCALSFDLLPKLSKLVDADTTTTLVLTLSDNVGTSLVSSEEDSIPRLADILSPLGNLHTLQLRWFQIHWEGVPTAQLAARSLLLSDCDRSLLSRLRTMAVEGLYASQACLLELLQACTQLEELTLKGIHLTTGSFVPIFRHIDEKMELKSLYLADLKDAKLNDPHANGQLIQFMGSSGIRRFLHKGGPTWMKRTQDDRFRRIRYQWLKGP